MTATMWCQQHIKLSSECTKWTFQQYQQHIYACGLSPGSAASPAQYAKRQESQLNFTDGFVPLSLTQNISLKLQQLSHESQVWRDDVTPLLDEVERLIQPDTLSVHEVGQTDGGWAGYTCLTVHQHPSTALLHRVYMWKRKRKRQKQEEQSAYRASFHIGGNVLRTDSTESWAKRAVTPEMSVQSLVTAIMEVPLNQIPPSPELNCRRKAGQNKLIKTIRC